MLHVHRAPRADALVAALGDLLAVPPADPFAPEVVSVPTRGMERWLAQQLSAHLGRSNATARDGICANVHFPFPRRLIGDAIAHATGFEPDWDPWAPERAVWPLLEIVDASLGEPWLRTLAAHLGAKQDKEDDDARRARRFSAVRHISDLYDRYATQRPEMLAAWAANEDVDGAGRPLAPDARWQAELWRRLNARIVLPGPAERLPAAITRLEQDPAVTDLPERLAIFGLTRVAAAHRQVISALSTHRDVHLFLLHPSPALWDKIAQQPAPTSSTRADDPTADIPRNRLLASWGQDARELQVALHATATKRDHPEHPTNDKDPTTLLERLQQAIRDDAQPADDERTPHDTHDESIRIHACHGRARQVEVLRDAILHALAADPTLEPRDVIVMCPDVETFAPLIHATFGSADEQVPEDVRPPDLRVRLADRSPRQTNPVLSAVAQLIELGSERMTASQVLDLAGREPVRRRFGFDDDDLGRMEEWTSESGIRWGLDAAHRAPYHLHRLAKNTWRWGMDRLLAGVAMSEDGHRLIGDVLPLDDVESGAIDLAGRFAEFVARLHAALDSFERPQPIQAWCDAIATAADSLTATSPVETWQRAELQRLLDDVVREATVDGLVHPGALSLSEVRALLADRLRGRPTRANFRTGHLTVCTLEPMRSIPHRVVCLLGLDDAAFPRKSPRDGDDLILADPHVGDRDARREDRQLLLDALMSASDRLIVTYSGNDERTNAQRPAAVPVGELLDAIDRTVTFPTAGAREHIVHRHALQPFDERNFAAAAPWSFDRVNLAGARALQADRTPAPDFLPTPLPAQAQRLIELDDLVRFVEHPVRAFLRQRLEVSVREFVDELDDGFPVELDGLEKWRVGQRLVDARLAGADMATALRAERARGALPPGHLDHALLNDEIVPRVDVIVHQALARTPEGASPASVDVNLTLPGDRVLSGTVAGVCGDVLRTVTYSKLKPAHRLAAWVKLLALSAAHPQRPFTAVTIGRLRDNPSRRWAKATISHIAPVGAEDARRHLAALVDVYDRGLCAPPPLYSTTSEAWALGRDPQRAAREAWTTPDFGFDREDKDLEHVLVLGGRAPFEALLAAASRPEEPFGPADQPTRFGRWAHAVWDPCGAAETLEDAS